MDLFPSRKRVHGERSIGKNEDEKETSKSEIAKTEMVQKTRQEKRLQSCKEYNIQSHPPHQISVLYHKIKLFTCVVPKSGSTFWLPILKKKIGGTSIGQNPNIKPWDRYVSTVFGRHPLLRFYSAYNDKYIGMTPRVLRYVGNFVNTHIRKQANRHPCYEDVTLEEFAKVVIYDIKHHLHETNHHWRPMYALCNMCHKNYSVIGHLESFQQDLNQLERVIYQQNQINITLSTGIPEASYLEDKCRYMLHSFWPYGAKHGICNSKTKLILKNKLKSLWNKGFLPKFGFNMTTFSVLPSSAWFDKCVKILNNTFRDPIKMQEVREVSKKTAVESLKSLPKEILNELIEVYRPDFELFGYDPREIFNL